MSNDEFQRITNDLTLHVAETPMRLNPDMTSIFITGTGTDSREKSAQHWAS